MSGERYKTPVGIGSFIHLFKKWGYRSNTPKFSIQVLLEKGIPANEKWLEDMQAVIESVVAAKWPNEKKRPRKLILPIKNGDTWEGDTDGIPKIDSQPYLENMWVVVISGFDQPAVLDMDGKKLDDVNCGNKIYAGVLGQALFDVYAYDNNNKGVSFGLKAFKKSNDGDPISGGSASETSVEEAQAAFGCEPGDPDNFPPVQEEAPGGAAKKKMFE